MLRSLALLLVVLITTAPQEGRYYSDLSELRDAGIVFKASSWNPQDPQHTPEIISDGFSYVAEYFILPQLPNADPFTPFNAPGSIPLIRAPPNPHA